MGKSIFDCHKGSRTNETALMRERQHIYNATRRKKYAEDAEYRSRVLEQSGVWVENNRDVVNGISRRWAKNNRGKCNAHQARYRARKLDQTPVDANHMWIDMIYEQCPTGYEVDHILSLANGGLHHEDNLQYLTISQNRRKH
jgi:hypothetical protein